MAVGAAKDVVHAAYVFQDRRRFVGDRGLAVRGAVREEILARTQVEFGSRQRIVDHIGDGRRDTCEVLPVFVVSASQVRRTERRAEAIRKIRKIAERDECVFSAPADVERRRAQASAGAAHRFEFRR